jgi:hypothetical protein
LAQYGLFRQYALREIVWAYPFGHDQTYYLSISYDTYEHILAQGLPAGLRYGVGLHPPTGLLLHLEAAVLYLFVGAGRLGALTVHFLHFAALQVAVVTTALWLSRRLSVALIAWGLLLCACSPYLSLGGLTDFRIDFPAACAFGVVVCLGLRAGVFDSRSWSLATGAAAAYLIVLRFLTAVYLAGMALALAAYLVLRWWRQRDPQLRVGERRRLANLALAGLVIAAVGLPVLWYQRHTLYDYYVVGHVTGREVAIRLLENADRDLWFYPWSLLGTHAGPVFTKLAATIVLAAGLLCWLQSWRRAWLAVVGPAAVFVAAWNYNGPRMWWVCGAAVALGAVLVPWGRRRWGCDPARQLPVRPALAMLALALAVPLAALSADLHCSPIVANIMLVPLLWLVLIPVLLAGSCATLAPAAESGLAILAALALTTGGWVQLVLYGQHSMMSWQRADNERLLELHDRVARAVLEYNLDQPHFSLTANPDYLPGRISEVLLYERHGVHRTFVPQLGGFYDFSERDTLNELDASDFVILARPQEARTPFEKAMRELLPRLRAYCAKHFVHLGTYHLFGDDVELYTRGLRLEGNDGGWITAGGLTIKAPGRVLEDARLELYAPVYGPLAGNPPHVQAMLSVPGQSPAHLPASLSQQGSGYDLIVDCTGANLTADAAAEIHLSFDGFFVPLALGMALDTRQLVLPSPERIRLLR